jgi:bacterioferritin (cytochrome b1)
MSDITLIAEDILNTMQAVDEAYHASQLLREKTDHVALDLFRVKMSELEERIGKIKMVLDNEEAYAIDELADALSMISTGHRAEYRKTPRLNE